MAQKIISGKVPAHGDVEAKNWRSRRSTDERGFLYIVTFQTKGSSTPNPFDTTPAVTVQRVLNPSNDIRDTATIIDIDEQSFQVRCGNPSGTITEGEFTFIAVGE